MVFLLRHEVILIGYARVSKSDGSQLLDILEDALLKAGVDQEYIYQDLASGQKDDRPGLKACPKALEPGNMLVVWKLDRLGRDMKHLVNLIDEMNHKKIGFKVLSGAEIDTTTANGRLVFGIFAALAEFERDLIRERAQAGLAAARVRDRNGGRPRKMDEHTIKMAMAAMSDRNSVSHEVAKRLNITTTTLYAYVDGDDSLKETGSKLINKLKRESS